MHILVTGLSGTLGPRLAQRAAASGWRVSGWDRRVVPADDCPEARREVDRLRPEAIVHLAVGSVGWAALLARHAHENAIPFVFTSTAMVFDHDPDGPHDVRAPRTARDDYGRDKIACEDAVLGACAQAAIARLGWQIDEHSSGNNMLAELDRWQARDGLVKASAHWTPACSFMDDTVDVLLDLVVERSSGTLHLDSNAVEGWRFDQVVHALRARFARDWDVEVDQTPQAYRHDQRLIGGNVKLPPLSLRLPGLLR